MTGEECRNRFRHLQSMESTTVWWWWWWWKTAINWWTKGIWSSLNFSAIAEGIELLALMRFLHGLLRIDFLLSSGIDLNLISFRFNHSISGSAPTTFTLYPDGGMTLSFTTIKLKVPARVGARRINWLIISRFSFLSSLVWLIVCSWNIWIV